MELFLPQTLKNFATAVTVSLPHDSRIGVFVSGGIDSALLYYLLLKEYHITNSSSLIYPIIIMRKADHAHIKIIKKINAIFDYEAPTLRFGNTTLPEKKQVESAIKQCLELPPYIQAVFIGHIIVQPQHAVNVETPIVPQHSFLHAPLSNLDKGQILSLYYQFNITDLLLDTYSCDVPGLTPCGACNGCNERRWGFEQIGKLDPCSML